MRSIYERQLCQLLTDKPCYELTRRFIGGHNSLTELKVGSKTADLVFFDIDLRTIVAVELKVSKWRRALLQAMTYQLWATESYVALSRKHVSGALDNRRVFQECGVGLISVDGFSKVEIEARESLYLKPQYIRMAIGEISRRLSGDEEH